MGKPFPHTSSQDPASWVGWGQEYGLVPVSKKSCMVVSYGSRKHGYDLEGFRPEGGGGWAPGVATSKSASTDACHEVVKFDYKAVENTAFSLNPLTGAGNYSATSSNMKIMKLIHWPLTGGMLLLVQRGGDRAGPQPTQAPLRCTKCNIPSINGQCTNYRAVV